MVLWKFRSVKFSIMPFHMITICPTFIIITTDPKQIHPKKVAYYQSTVGFRWSWAWNDERGEWEFEKMTKITQYRHNINTSIKKRVIVSFYNVSCSLSDTWLAKKRKNIFFTRPTILFLIFDLTFLWFFDFFVQLWVPCGTCGGKPLPVFQFPSK